MITSYAQQVVSTILSLLHITSHNRHCDVSSCSVTDPMLLAFETLQNSCQAESMDEARRMLMNEYVKQLSAANNNSRLRFWRRKRATERSLGRRTALAAYKQTKPYAEYLVTDKLHKLAALADLGNSTIRRSLAK